MAFSSRSLWLIGGVFFVTLVGGFFLLPPASDADDSSPSAAPPISEAVADTATFAGGCFWCMEPPYDKIDGVASTTSGFAGGEMVDPSYQQVASGATEHTEVVQVVYDSTAVSYERLLRVYWHNVDPFDGTGQFCDRGSQYRPAIFAHDAQQQRSAERSKDTVAARFDRDIAVQVQSLDAFYAAEDYHQNYYQKNPADYKRYRQGCGRDARLREVWGDAAGSDAPLSIR
ncbi:peptide-methionine (S)-S-oxide reductase MsrA [Salinibacter sp.]|uniref:peptide-methionine (S)-S-oxide reductase MsrA n=1 Tax=Salinibacter sp. TaxID=2065818 RepID=UPI0021E90A54|nr:peptide-methionine (S)-S-oxide reductase MsrA [Salinibacter sp.]